MLTRGDANQAPARGRGIICSPGAPTAAALAAAFPVDEDSPSSPAFSSHLDLPRVGARATASPGAIAALASLLGGGGDEDGENDDSRAGGEGAPASPDVGLATWDASGVGGAAAARRESFVSPSMAALFSDDVTAPLQQHAAPDASTSALDMSTAGVRSAAPAHHHQKTPARSCMGKRAGAGAGGAATGGATDARASRVVVFGSPRAAEFAADDAPAGSLTALDPSATRARFSAIASAAPTSPAVSVESLETGETAANSHALESWELSAATLESSAARAKRLRSDGRRARLSASKGDKNDAENDADAVDADAGKRARRESGVFIRGPGERVGDSTDKATDFSMDVDVVAPPAADAARPPKSPRRGVVAGGAALPAARASPRLRQAAAAAAVPPLSPIDLSASAVIEGMYEDAPAAAPVAHTVAAPYPSGGNTGAGGARGAPTATRRRATLGNLPPRITLPPPRPAPATAAAASSMSVAGPDMTASASVIDDLAFALGTSVAQAPTEIPCWAAPRAHDESQGDLTADISAVLLRGVDGKPVFPTAAGTLDGGAGARPRGGIRAALDDSPLSTLHASGGVDSTVQLPQSLAALLGNERAALRADGVERSNAAVSRDSFGDAFAGVVGASANLTQDAHDDTFASVDAARGLDDTRDTSPAKSPAVPAPLQRAYESTQKQTELPAQAAPQVPIADAGRSAAPARATPIVVSAPAAVLLAATSLAALPCAAGLPAPPVAGAADLPSPTSSLALALERRLLAATGVRTPSADPAQWGLVAQRAPPTPAPVPAPVYAPAPVPPTPASAPAPTVVVAAPVNFIDGLALHAALSSALAGSREQPPPLAAALAAALAKTAVPSTAPSETPLMMPPATHMSAPVHTQQSAMMSRTPAPTPVVLIAASTAPLVHPSPAPPAVSPVIPAAPAPTPAAVPLPAPVPVPAQTPVANVTVPAPAPSPAESVVPVSALPVVATKPVSNGAPTAPPSAGAATRGWRVAASRVDSDGSTRLTLALRAACGPGVTFSARVPAGGGASVVVGLETLPIIDAASALPPPEGWNCGGIAGAFEAGLAASAAACVKSGVPAREAMHAIDVAAARLAALANEVVALRHRASARFGGDSADGSTPLTLTVEVGSKSTERFRIHFDCRAAAVSYPTTCPPATVAWLSGTKRVDVTRAVENSIALWEATVEGAKAGAVYAISKAAANAAGVTLL